MVDLIALLRLQGRESRPRRVHALLQRERPARGVPGFGREIPELHDGVRIQNRMRKSRWRNEIELKKKSGIRAALDGNRCDIQDVTCKKA